MSEPACLRRSFSHPSNASREAKEGDPLRALTESISFGRFMSESLAWEKWSTFSHNRYLEEVEQFSKPGSVAQKKAYFEAHYKRRAAMKAAALLDQANSAVISVPEEETAIESLDNSMETELTKANDDVVIIEQQDTGVIDTEITRSIDAVAYRPEDQSDNLQNDETESYETLKKMNAEAENLIPLGHSMHFEDAESPEKFVSAPEVKMRNKEIVENDNVAPSRNKRQINVPPKTSSQTRAAKLQKSSPSKAISTQPKAGASADSNSKKSVGDFIAKKRSTPSSMHMSINFSSHLGDNSKSQPRMSKDGSPAAQNPTKKSVFGAPRLLRSIVRESPDKRTNSLFNKSISGGILQALSKDSSKSSASGSKSRTSIISSPFSFRSEERAAKRKEFYQKLEEKNNVKEKEKLNSQADAIQEKAVHRLTRLQQTGLRTKLSDDTRHGSQSPRNQTKKIPLTRPRSPKLGRKPSSCVVQETSTRLPQRPPANTENSKHVVPRSSHGMTRSVILPPKKKSHENASPNIQR